MPPPSFPTTTPPVEYAVIVSGGSGDVATEGAKSTTVEWLCRCNRPDAYPSEISASSFLPPRGDPLRRYRPNATGILESGQLQSYTSFDVINANMAVSGYSFRQHTDDPQMWSVSVKYDEAADPTTMPADFSSESVEYQDHVNLDIFGRPVDNSARDLIVGGMPVDRSYKLLKLVRSLPYPLWSSRKGDPFLNTLNKEPFFLSRQFDVVLDIPLPSFYPPGSVMIKKIAEQEVVRSPAPTSAGRQYYWRVSTDLHVDMRTFRQPDGTEFPTRHQFVYADAGFRQLTTSGERIPITQRGVPVTEQQLLDFKGKPLATQEARPGPPGGWTGGWPGFSAAPQVNWTQYETMKNTTLTVATPGALLTAYNPLVSATVDAGVSHGSLGFNPDGSFTYTPSADFVGWDFFTFIPTDGILTGTPVTVFVLVRAEYGPWWQQRDRYKTVSWAPLNDLLVGW